MRNRMLSLPLKSLHGPADDLAGGFGGRPGRTPPGRSGFLIHGDNSKGDHSASEGCIILGPKVREEIAKCKITKLRVVKE